MRTFTSVLLSASLALGSAHASDPMSEVESRLRPYTGDVPGAALLVLRDGEPVVRHAVGLADVEAGTPATPATNFRLASVSKQFTAAAVLLLAEDGALRLEDPVRRWLPGLPASADGVTLHHLLSHTSGLHDYEDVMDAAFAGQVRDADVMCLLATGEVCGGSGVAAEAAPTGARSGTPRTPAEPYFPPGTAYRYSNSAYALLAVIVEKVSGLAYPDFLRQRIFAPLGMDGTVAFVDGTNEVPNRAFGHSAKDGAWVRTDQSSTSAVLGDGGIYSSIDDMAKWDAALYDDRLLSDASRALAFSAQTTTPTGEADVAAYGYGWRLDGEGLLWHSGETIGFRNVILRWPAQRLTVLMLTNRSHPEPYADARAIGDAFLRSAADTR